VKKYNIASFVAFFAHTAWLQKKSCAWRTGYKNSITVLQMHYSMAQADRLRCLLYKRKSGEGYGMR
jgi:hypothetical protein